MRRGSLKQICPLCTENSQQRLNLADSRPSSRLCRVTQSVSFTFSVISSGQRAVPCMKHFTTSELKQCTLEFTFSATKYCCRGVGMLIVFMVEMRQYYIFPPFRIVLLIHKITIKIKHCLRLLIVRIYCPDDSLFLNFKLIVWKSFYSVFRSTDKTIRSDVFPV